MTTKTKKQKKLIPELRFSEFFGEWEEKMGEISQKISNDMSTVIKDFHRVSSQLTSSVESLNQTSKHLEKFQELYNSDLFKQIRKWQEVSDRMVELNEEEKEAMKQSGWWMSPSLMSVDIRYIYKSVSEYVDGNQFAIDDLFKSIYEENNCIYLEKVVSEWLSCGNYYFLPWEIHLKSALRAHQNKEYALSVPVLLLITEGIVTEFCKKNNILNKKDSSKGGKKLKKALIDQRKKDLNNVSFSELDILILFIDEVLFNNTNKVDIKKNILNRHAVLHGLKADYNSVENSLKAFMILDFLSLLK